MKFGWVADALNCRTNPGGILHTCLAIRPWPLQQIAWGFRV